MRKINKKIKGFTLVEIIVAMAILGITSLLLVTMYSAVAVRVKANDQLNDRMSHQQAIIEKKKLTDAEKDLFNVVADNNIDETIKNKFSAASAEDCYLMITCTHDGSGNGWAATGSEKTFRVNCSTYELKKIEDGAIVTDDDEMKVNFRYFEGSNAVK